MNKDEVVIGDEVIIRGRITGWLGDDKRSNRVVVDIPGTTFNQAVFHIKDLEGKDGHH